MSDRIVVMRDGKDWQDGTPRESLRRAQNLFVAGFIGEINMFNATVIERLDEQRVRANVEGREVQYLCQLRGGSRTKAASCYVLKICA